MQAFIVLNSEIKRLGYNEFRIQWEVPRLRLEVMSIHLSRKRVIIEDENVYENIYDDSDDDMLPELQMTMMTKTFYLCNNNSFI